MGAKGEVHTPSVAPSLKEVINYIHIAKGLAIIAHPWYFRNNLDFVLSKFSKLGGDGIEVSSPTNKEIPKIMEKKLRNFAKKYNLLISGGADFHRLVKGEKEMGDRGLSLKEFKNLKEGHRKKFNK